MQSTLFNQAPGGDPHLDFDRNPVDDAIRSQVETILTLVQDGGGDGLVNPWKHTHPDLDSPGGAARRRDNLRLYLSERLAWAQTSGQQPTLAVGEAVGYQGGRFSGVAFTSERLILAGRLGVGYQPSSQRPEGWAEPSATIVWSTFDAVNQDRGVQNGTAGDVARHVILWNTVVWHPHRPGEPLTNRTPTRSETEAGLELTSAVIDIIRPGEVLGIGRIAADTLGVPRLRHPAHGGATQFRQQLSEHLE